MPQEASYGTSPSRPVRRPSSLEFGQARNAGESEMEFSDIHRAASHVIDLIREFLR